MNNSDPDQSFKVKKPFVLDTRTIRPPLTFDLDKVAINFWVSDPIEMFETIVFILKQYRDKGKPLPLTSRIPNSDVFPCALFCALSVTGKIQITWTRTNNSTGVLVIPFDKLNMTEQLYQKFIYHNQQI